MPKIGRYTKKSKLNSACEQLKTGSAVTSPVHKVDCLIPPPVVLVPPQPHLYAPFNRPILNHCLLHRLARMVFKLEVSDEDLDPEVDEVDSFEQYADNLFAALETPKRKGRKTTEFRNAGDIERAC
ncbi:hypothetical protein AHAS_Ahas14G0172400 [Arachis hypogaea]